jgi:hypothetical protein
VPLPTGTCSCSTLWKLPVGSPQIFSAILNLEVCGPCFSNQTARMGHTRLRLYKVRVSPKGYPRKTPSSLLWKLQLILLLELLHLSHIYGCKHTEPRMACIATLPLHRVHCMHRYTPTPQSPSHESQSTAACITSTKETMSSRQDTELHRQTTSHTANQAYSTWPSVARDNPGRWT